MNKSSPWIGYVVTSATAALCTLIGMVMAPRFDIVNIAMVYLVAVVLAALRYSRATAVYCALLCVALFDTLFVPPYGRFSVNDVQYLFTFVVMAGIAMLISGLMTAARREAQERVAASVEAETERIRSTLLASISHDLRTPLAVMAGASSSLVEGGERLSATEREALARSIYVQSRDMADQVAKVLQMTRLEMGAIVLERDWTSVSEITGSVLGRLADRLAALHLIVQVPSDLPLVRVDATLIEQVLTNLLENAVRHTPPQTAVLLRAELDPQSAGQEMVVSVEDHGPGLDERDLENVFVKFHHGGRDGAIADGATGVGLGLAICRAIVKLHGGRIWAEHMPGGGAVFRFTLPVEKAPPAPAEGPAASDAAQPVGQAMPAKEPGAGTLLT